MNLNARVVPPNGTIEYRYQFLWWPLTIDGKTRWLETATWAERCVYLASIDGYFPAYEWEPVEWID